VEAMVMRLRHLTECSAGRTAGVLRYGQLF
jgi:hypothetical protein